MSRGKDIRTSDSEWAGEKSNRTGVPSKIGAKALCPKLGPTYATGGAGTFAEQSGAGHPASGRLVVRFRIATGQRPAIATLGNGRASGLAARTDCAGADQRGLVGRCYRPVRRSRVRWAHPARSWIVPPTSRAGGAYRLSCFIASTSCGSSDWRRPANPAFSSG
jgi:hypothetical protein